jgi:hypothetical protein
MFDTTDDIQNTKYVRTTAPSPPPSSPLQTCTSRKREGSVRNRKETKGTKTSFSIENSGTGLTLNLSRISFTVAIDKEQPGKVELMRAAPAIKTDCREEEEN